MQLRIFKVLLALLSLMSIAFAWKLTMDLGGTEFSGGSITGPLYRISELAFLLLILALMLVIRLPRASATLVGLASLLCMPLSFLFLAPGPFRRIVGGEWSVPLQSDFVLAWWTVGWSFSLAACLVISLAILIQPRSGGRIEPGA